MAFPKQPNVIEDDRQAKAPYNFVSLPDRVVKLTAKVLPDQDRYWPQETVDGAPARYSGRIACELTTESPLYTRAAVTTDNYGRGVKSKDESAFFYIVSQDQPVIPGSSLRGLMRSLVEIVSYSKVGPVSDRQLVYRAVGDTTSHGDEYRKRLMRFDGERDRQKHYTPLMRAGYMKKMGSDWAIEPAQEIGGATYAHCFIEDRDIDPLPLVHPSENAPPLKNARHIYIRPGRYDYQNVRGGFLRIKYAPALEWSRDPKPGMLRGTIMARSGPINSKRSEAVVYERDPDKKPWVIDDHLLEMYQEQISDGQQQILGNKDGILRDGQPVFYLIENDRLAFFGHCRMLRLPYLRKLCDLVPEELRREEDLDLAEAIFGYTKRKGTGKDRAYAGRVFFSDATLLDGQGSPWLADGRVVTPRILAGPKPTTFQHYLVQQRPNKKQVGTTRDGRPKYIVELSDYAAPTPGETVIRGHKLYWHKGPATLDDIRETETIKEGDKQHTRIQPLRPGVAFRFHIDFENLLTVELGALLWVLRVAADPAYRLKLGMGKPLGMGAVKIVPTLELTDRLARYQTLLNGNGWATATAADPQGADKAVAEFERFMLRALKEPDSVKRLNEVARIRELLALLSWPGPDREETRYLEIERRVGGRKVNEYRDRPVLPSPLVVASRRGRAGDAEPPRASSGQPATGKPTPGSPLPPGYQRGTVLEFGPSYGYIQPEGGGKRVFVHRNQLAGGRRFLEPGQIVTFRIGPGMKGPEAQDVKVVG